MRAVASHVALTDVLGAAEAARSKRAGGGDGAPTIIDPRPRTPEPVETNYWAVVFEVVTPAAWQRLVESATGQARAGDPRAREWIASVLGADSAIDELGRADAAAVYVDVSKLGRALERERSAEARPSFEY
ncbi:MAG TPA: hypothetical protein VMV69_29495 [Pirellulales bacterium]|nr:hypothetical protein [Pirellulales bacterium]